MVLAIEPLALALPQARHTEEPISGPEELIRHMILLSFLYWYGGHHQMLSRGLPRLGVLAATAAVVATTTSIGAPAWAESVYTVTEASPGRPYAEHPRWEHPLIDEIDIKRVWGGRNATTAFARVRIGDLLTPRQIRRRAPYAEMHVEFSFSSETSGGDKLGFTAGELVVDRNGTRMIKVREQYDPTCQISLGHNRKLDRVIIAAPYACGLPEDPAGKPVEAGVDTWVTLKKNAPRRVEGSGDFEYFDINP